MSASATSTMHYDPRVDAVASAHPLMPDAIPLSTKSSVILIRWPVVLISACLILFCSRTLPMVSLLDGLIVLYALSNAALSFVDDSAFRKLRFNVASIGLDSLVLTASLVVNGDIETNFSSRTFC
jgi:hypothetical protein